MRRTDAGGLRVKPPIDRRDWKALDPDDGFSLKERAGVRGQTAVQLHINVHGERERERSR